MGIYYHKKVGGFFMDRMHGPRFIEVDDPTWTAPLIEVDDPGADPDVSTKPKIKVIDPLAYPNKVSVANPQCTLPPEDELVVISEETYLGLLEGQGQGLLISSDDNGVPFLAKPAPLSKDEQEVKERTWRDRALSATDGLVARHRDEIEMDMPLTISSADYKELQLYRNALRGWPLDSKFPDAASRPTTPNCFV